MIKVKLLPDNYSKEVQGYKLIRIICQPGTIEEGKQYGLFLSSE